MSPQYDAKARAKITHAGRRPESVKTPGPVSKEKPPEGRWQEEWPGQPGVTVPAPPRPMLAFGARSLAHPLGSGSSADRAFVGHMVCDSPELKDLIQSNN